MRNKDVVQAFLRGEKAKTKNLSSSPALEDRQQLYSYKALIAERDPDSVWLCRPYKMTKTTRYHCNLIARALGYASFAKGLEEQNG